MSVPCKNSLTDRELSVVYGIISDKFVDKLCVEIINDTTVSGNFSKLIQDKMIEILGKAETQDKMADAVLQSVGTTLRHSTKGPYLLYALLNNGKSLPKVKEVMTKVFNDIYKEGDNKYVFVKRLAMVLNEPHTGLFVTSEQRGGRTHKRRKISRKSRSMRGGTKQRGGANPAATAAVLSTATNLASNLASNLAANAAANAAADPATGSGTGAALKTVAGAGAASNNAIIANELYFNYEKALLDNATKNINAVSNHITTKMVNASYIYMLKNGQPVLDAVRSNIETSLSKQSSSYDVNKIIIIQALFSARNELTRSIHTVANKRAKMSPGFNPISPAFISDVVHELLQNIRLALNIK